MNKTQALLIFAFALTAFIIPWFSVGTLCMGIAIGMFLSIILAD